MQTLMEGYGVWKIAKGTELKPNAAAGATAAQIQDCYLMKLCMPEDWFFITIFSIKLS
jgi:hypothetical protein